MWRDWGCIGLCLIIGAAWGFFAFSLEAATVGEVMVRTLLGMVLGALFGVFVGRRLLEALSEWMP